MISLNFCYLIVIAFTRHFKGHLKILAATLYHKGHYPESYYQQSISNGIISNSILEKSENHLENFWKLPSKTFMLEIFLSTFERFSKSCSEQLFCREPVWTYFCKKTSTGHVGLKFTKKELHYRALPQHFEHMLLKIWLSSFSVVLLYAISLQFFKTSRRSTFRNIPMIE